MQRTTSFFLLFGSCCGSFDDADRDGDKKSSDDDDDDKRGEGKGKRGKGKSELGPKMNEFEQRQSIAGFFYTKFLAVTQFFPHLDHYVIKSFGAPRFLFVTEFDRKFCQTPCDR